MNNNTVHCLGNYNYVEGTHEVHGGNTVGAIVARYYGKYLGYEKRDGSIFINNNVDKIRGVWKKMHMWNRGRLERAGWDGNWNNLPSGINLVVDPFAARRVEKIRLKKREEQHPEKVKGGETHYILKYTTDDGNSEDFNHHFTSITYGKDINGNEATLIQEVIINNKSLGVTSSVKVEGVNVNNGKPIPLDHPYQISDDMLWLQSSRLRYYIQYIRNREKTDSLASLIDLNTNNQKLFVSLMNPNKSLVQTKDNLKPILTIASQGISLLALFFPGIPIVFKVGAFLGGVIASHILEDKVEKGEVVLYASK